jgi:hypothetical protein
MVRKPIPFASVPFEYGTNGVVQIERQIDTSGVYDLHVKFHKVDIPLDALGRYPEKLQIHMYVLVTTNGMPTRDRDLQALDFNSSQDPNLVRYGLVSFQVANQTHLSCLIKDVGDGSLKMRGVVVLEQRFPK